MIDSSSQAPKERINIVYKASIGDAKEEKELPFKVVAMADYTQRPDSRPVEAREPININKDNFSEVMAGHKLKLNLSVPNVLSEEEGQDLGAELRFESMKDFSPDVLATQVPELEKMLELREALMALKGPLRNIPSVRKTIEKILGNEASREKLKAELGVTV
jgi:type VI secretion system protein ImpB